VYLQARDAVTAELAQRRSKTLTAAGNQDLASIWETLRSAIVEKYVAFAPIFYRYLERDPQEELRGVEVEDLGAQLLEALRNVERRSRELVTLGYELCRDFHFGRAGGSVRHVDLLVVGVSVDLAPGCVTTAGAFFCRRC
jgi:hypothetical protein